MYLRFPTPQTSPSANGTRTYIHTSAQNWARTHSRQLPARTTPCSGLVGSRRQHLAGRTGSGQRKGCWPSRRRKERKKQKKGKKKRSSGRAAQTGCSPNAQRRRDAEIEPHGRHNMYALDGVDPVGDRRLGNSARGSHVEGPARHGSAHPVTTAEHQLARETAPTTLVSPRRASARTVHLFAVRGTTSMRRVGTGKE